MTSNRPQGCQIVTCMEVVDPALVRELAVLPRAVSSLPADGIARSLQGRINQSLISSVLIQSTEESDDKEIRIVNLRLRGRQRVTEGSDFNTLCVVELFHQVIACAQRHFQTSCVPERFESIQQGIRNKDCANQVGRAARN